MSSRMPGAPAMWPTMVHPDITLGLPEGKWCVSLASKHPTRASQSAVSTSDLNRRIRDNRQAPIKITGAKTTMGKNKSNRSASKTRRVWPTVTMNWTTQEKGLIDLAIATSPEGMFTVNDKTGAISGTTVLPLPTSECHLCKMVGVATTLTEGEEVKIWVKDGETRISGVACSDKHWDKSARVTVPAAPQEKAAKPAAAKPTAPKAAKVAAAPKPSTPKASEAPAPKVKSDVESIIRAAKAAGASVVKLADGTTIIF